MKRIKFFNTLILVITWLVATMHFACNGQQSVQGQKELFSTYCSTIEQKAKLSSSNNLDKTSRNMMRAVKAAENIDVLFRSINTSTQQSFGFPCLNDDLCALFDPFNQDAPIKPSSMLGCITLTNLLSTPLESSTDLKFLENHALIHLFNQYPDLRNVMHIALRDLDKKMINAFVDNHTFMQWMELDKYQPSTFYSMISNAGYVTDAINAVLYGEHFGARALNWTTSWLPTMFNTALPAWDPYYPILYCAGGLLKIASNSTRLAQACQEKRATEIKTIVDPFIQALQKISTALQGAFHLTGNEILKNLADELILKKTIAVPSAENLTAIVEVLTTIGTIDVCLALATAQANGTIKPITITSGTHAANMKLNNLEQSLTTLWKLSAPDQASPWIRDGNTLNMPIKMAQENTQKVSRLFLTNLILSQTIGFVIAPDKTPVQLPLLDMSRVSVTSLSRCCNNTKIEFIASVTVAPLPEV